MKKHKHLNRQRAARRKQLKSVMQIGPKPAEASEFFLHYNKDLYNVPMDHVISCKMPPYKATDLGKRELDMGIELRDQRELFYINAGTPKRGRPDAGRAFHGYPWVKNDDDGAFTPVDWEFELSKEQRLGTRWIDPIGPDTKPDPYNLPFDVKVNKTPHNTKADFLAQCMGHKALCTPSTEAFQTFVLGVPTDYKTGASMQAFKEVNPDEWTHQRNCLFNSFQKIYMVYPHPVDPVFDQDGRVFPKGELTRSPNAPKLLTIVHEVEDEEFETPQPVVFVTLTADTTSKEAKGLDPARVLSGPHDTTRAWPLLPSHVVAIRKLLKHYELEDQFPALSNLHVSAVRKLLKHNESRDGAMLNLEYHRNLGMQRLGLPSGEDYEPIPRGWLNKVANLPFGKVWVQKCTLECPDGMVEFGTDEPMLVPLLRGRAEEKNGTPWIDSRKLEEDRTLEETRRYVGVMKALYCILGKNWDKSRIKRDEKRKTSGRKRKLSKTKDEVVLVDCTSGAMRVQWPTCGRLTLTLGKRGCEDFKEINVPSGMSVMFTYKDD
jgi:hypothetical protein